MSNGAAYKDEYGLTKYKGTCNPHLSPQDCREIDQKVARCSSARKNMRIARRDYWDNPSYSNFEYMESAIESAYDPDCI